MSTFRVGFAVNLVAYVDAVDPEEAKSAVEKALGDKVIHINQANGLKIEHDTELLMQPSPGDTNVSAVATFGAVLSEPDMMGP